MTYKKLKYWFDGELALLLSDKINSITPDFDSIGFFNTVDTGVKELELKDRVELIADELFNRLGDNFKTAIKHLVLILGPENPEETGMFTNFYWIMPIAKIIEKYGLNDFDLSMNAIEEVTKRNTGEYTIRPFIKQYPERTMEKMVQWSKDQNFHVRRLACEGARPRLPWAAKLEMFIENPQPLLPILENLKDDNSKYVQKSVANCLNDILKDNYDQAIELIKLWSKNPGKNCRWIIKHALRNLNKKGDEGAVTILNKLH